MKPKEALGVIRAVSKLAKEVSKIDASGMTINENAINYIQNRFNGDEIDKETIKKVLKYNHLYMQLEIEEISKKLGG